MSERDYSSLTDVLENVPLDTLELVRERVAATLADIEGEVRVLDRIIAKRKREREPKFVMASNGLARHRIPVMYGGGEGVPVPQSLKREELLSYVAAMNRPVRPAEVRAYVAEMGIERTAEAIRNGLSRLVSDGRLERLADGRYAVRNGDESEAGTPDGAGASFETTESAARSSG